LLIVVNNLPGKPATIYQMSMKRGSDKASWALIWGIVPVYDEGETA
jgi:hypothetical protein